LNRRKNYKSAGFLFFTADHPNQVAQRCNRRDYRRGYGNMRLQPLALDNNRAKSIALWGMLA
jgi:hypothetical protein